jgi:hypothetical protein
MESSSFRRNTAYRIFYDKDIEGGDQGMKEIQGVSRND